MTANPYHTTDQQLLADADGVRELERNLSRLCDHIGPRFAGTDGYRRAAEFMRNQFREYQLARPHLEPFEFTAWRRGAPASLVMTAPWRREYECYALPYGAATGRPGLRAGVLDVGAGAPADFETHRQTMPGRFVLTNGAGGHRMEIYARCVERGAAGLVLSNRLPGMSVHSGSVADGEAGAIPAVSVPLETGLQLQRFAQLGPLELELVTNGRCEPATTWNVVGELSGCEQPDELVIIGGHLDSHEIGPGAYDNAAGALVVLETARLLAKHRPHLKRPIRFIGFGAEEVGLLGSQHHARSHAAELRQARVILNCDMPALSSPWGLAFYNCPSAEPYVAQLSAQLGVEIAYREMKHCHSDHYPFALQGVPAASLVGGRAGLTPPRFGHMAADTADKIPVANLAEAAVLTARILLRAANDESWPRPPADQGVGTADGLGRNGPLVRRGAAG